MENEQWRPGGLDENFTSSAQLHPEGARLIVLADRYTYTAFARDEARGLDKTWVRNLYRFTVDPDAVFYLHISPEEAVRRRVALQQRVVAVERPEKRGEKKQKKQLERAAATVQLPPLAPETM